MMVCIGQPKENKKQRTENQIKDCEAKKVICDSARPHWFKK
jgi:hypothetical protein